MRLLVDIGNTQVKYVFQQTDDESMFSDVVYLDYQPFLQALASKDFADVSELIVANVHANNVLVEIEAWASAQNIAFLQVQSQAKAFGVSSSYLQPESLGVDRWLAIIAAHQLYPQQNVLIIDAGTATTVDLLAANGQHLGGWIMPGVQTMFTGLLSNTQKIVAEPIHIANVSFGINSSQCLNHGVWAMTIGAIKEAIVQANKLLTVNKVLLTGGNSEQLAGLINDDYELVPSLIFHGLSCFHAS